MFACAPRRGNCYQFWAFIAHMMCHVRPERAIALSPGQRTGALAEGRHPGDACPRILCAPCKGNYIPLGVLFSCPYRALGGWACRLPRAMPWARCSLAFSPPSSHAISYGQHNTQNLNPNTLLPWARCSWAFSPFITTARLRLLP